MSARPKTPGSGRKKGTPNRSTQSVQEVLDRLNCNPFEGMAVIARNELPCGVCRGTGRTKYKLASGEVGERTCESCYGTLFEACSPDLRGKMNAELAQYVGAKRKAIDITNSDGSMNRATILRERFAKRTSQ